VQYDCPTSEPTNPDETESTSFATRDISQSVLLEEPESETDTDPDSDTEQSDDDEPRETFPLAELHDFIDALDSDEELVNHDLIIVVSAHDEDNDRNEIGNSDDENSSTVEAIDESEHEDPSDDEENEPSDEYDNVNDYESDAHDDSNDDSD
jgi:hypothetical protein